MGIIAWIVLGALAGWIASLFMNTNEEQGAIANVIVGIFGAVVGGLIMGFFGADGVTGFNLYSLLVAIGGAVVLIAVYRALRRHPQ